MAGRQAGAAAIGRGRAVACALCVAVSAWPHTGVAQAGNPAPATEAAGAHEAVPLWEVGLYPVAGWQPAYPGSDQHLTKGAVLPYGIWRGSVLRVENGGVGVRALTTPRLEWDLNGAGAFGASANEVRARAGMPTIGTLGQIGPELRVNLGDLVDARYDPQRTRLALPLRAVFDVSHQLRPAGWTFEPRLTHTAWQGETSSVAVGASILLADQRLAHLFYGVDPAYATPDRPAYTARGGLVATRLDLSLRRTLNPRLRMQWTIEAETVRGAANASSPLVRRLQDVGVGVSLTWLAFVSSRSGVQ